MRAVSEGHAKQGHTAKGHAPPIDQQHVGEITKEVQASNIDR